MAKNVLDDSPTPHKLGVHLVEGGATVGVWAAHATAVHLCLFDKASLPACIGLIEQIFDSDFTTDVTVGRAQDGTHAATGNLAQQAEASGLDQFRELEVPRRGR